MKTAYQKSLKDKRFFKVKNAKRHFLCALCGSPRAMRYSKNLSLHNYLQILVISACLSWSLFPLMQWNSPLMLFVIWPIFEIVNKILYRREIPCPYCGFDATWYRRDVRVARSKVENFWSDAPLVQKKQNTSEENDRLSAQ